MKPALSYTTFCDERAVDPLLLLGYEESIPKGSKRQYVDPKAFTSPEEFSTALLDYCSRNGKLEQLSKRFSRKDRRLYTEMLRLRIEEKTAQGKIKNEGDVLRLAAGIAGEMITQRLAADMVGHMQRDHRKEYVSLMSIEKDSVLRLDFGALKFTSERNCELYLTAQCRQHDCMGEADGVVITQKKAAKAQLYWLDACTSDDALEEKIIRDQSKWRSVRQLLSGNGRREADKIHILYNGNNPGYKKLDIEHSHQISVPHKNVVTELCRLLLKDVNGGTYKEFKQSIRAQQKNIISNGKSRI